MFPHRLAAVAPCGALGHSLRTVELIQNYYSVWGTKFSGQNQNQNSVNINKV